MEKQTAQAKKVYLQKKYKLNLHDIFMLNS